MIAEALFLILSQRGQTFQFHHYLADLVKDESFHFHSQPYAQKNVVYFQTENERDTAGNQTILELHKLQRASTISDLRRVLHIVYSNKEKGLSKDIRFRINDYLSSYFSAVPGMMKQLSVEDICALLMIDSEFVTNSSSWESLWRVANGFSSLNKRDFDSPDIALGFLRISNNYAMPNSSWNFDRQDWSLDTVRKYRLNGVVSIGITSYREVAQAIRKKDVSIIDQAIKRLDDAATELKIKEDRDSALANAKTLKRQKALLVDLIRKRKGGQ